MASYLVQNKDGSLCLAVEATSKEQALKECGLTDTDGHTATDVSAVVPDNVAAPAKPFIQIPVPAASAVDVDPK
jgi:hypothetical protein